MTVAVPDSARCLHCGYALRGLPEAVCPECGNAFDPARPETFKDPARAKPLRPLQPPSRLQVLLLWILATLAAALGNFSMAPIRLWTADWDSLQLIVLLLLAAPLVGLVVRAICARRHQRAGRDELLVAYRAARGRQRLLVVALILLYVGVFLPPWIPMVRFYSSWAALNGEAERYLTDPNTDIGPRWVGPLHVEYIWGRGQGFVWFQTNHRGHCRYGFVRVGASAARSAGGWYQVAPGWYIAEW